MASPHDRTPTTAQLAVDGIKDYIRSNGLKPGDTMPTETELCAELGFSRSSVREAIRTLVALDIVEVRHGRGTFVSQARLSALVQGLIFRASLDSEGQFETLRYVVETRRAMDLSIGEEAARALDDATFEQLTELVDAMDAKREHNFADEDRQFHRVLLSVIDNPIIRELNDAFWQVHMEVIPLRGIAKPRDLGRTVRAHRAILEALRAGDMDAYRAAVNEHYQPLLEEL
ncbi:FadR/GntR family transcriptional regulator [Corynebacterium sp.]|uniref:FadR/GntR family transcriptional regulator n=1 Tax=Corynebacterium sp. TaxID=1720 RepID=UPI0026DB481C|nr:FadR/GntR family transcriptional regulator [Corynebacterium sp.]MDO5031110.1 FadR/GntR family transcriptional regulator [Corynebacterium sp.]